MCQLEPAGIYDLINGTEILPPDRCLTADTQLYLVLNHQKLLDEIVCVIDKINELPISQFRIIMNSTGIYFNILALGMTLYEKGIPFSSKSDFTKLMEACPELSRYKTDCERRNQAYFIMIHRHRSELELLWQEPDVDRIRSILLQIAHFLLENSMLNNANL